MSEIDNKVDEIASIVNIYSESAMIEIGEKLASDKIHRTLQNNFFKLIKSFIVTQSKKSDNQFDGRNEKTVEICKKMVKEFDVDTLMF